MKEKILEKPKLFFMLVNALIFWIVIWIVILSNYAGSIFLLIVPVFLILLMILLNFSGGKKKYGRLLGLLHDHCYPAAYIKEARNLLRLEQEKEHPKDVSLLKLYLSDGLYAAGRFREAMETLDGIEITRNNENTVFSADYYHRRFLVSLEMERQDTAWDSLVKMREILIDIKNRSMRELYTKIYDEDNHMLNAAKGECEGAERALKGLLGRAQTNYERSFVSYLLGGLYKRLGKETEAEDAYKNVLAWGSKLYIAGKSAEILGIKGWED